MNGKIFWSLLISWCFLIHYTSLGTTHTFENSPFIKLFSVIFWVYHLLLIEILNDTTFSIYFIFFQHFQDTLMSQHHESDTPLLPDLLKSLWVSQLWPKVKMEPEDYGGFQLSLIPLFYLAQRVENWLCQDQVDTHHRSYTATCLLIKNCFLCPTDLALLTMFLMCI
jgi:hypothetical protein